MTDDVLDAAWAEYEAGAEDEADFKRIVRQHTARTVVEVLRDIEHDAAHAMTTDAIDRIIERYRADWITRTGSA